MSDKLTTNLKSRKHYCSTMARRCIMCQGIYVNQSGLIEHFKTRHAIEDPKFFWHTIYKKHEVIDSYRHWRCLKFFCEKCPFTCHLKSWVALLRNLLYVSYILVFFRRTRNLTNEVHIKKLEILCTVWRSNMKPMI